VRAKPKKAALEVIKRRDGLGHEDISGTLPGNHRTTGSSTSRDVDEKAEPPKFEDPDLVDKPTYLASVGSSLVFGDKSAMPMDADVDTRSLETRRMLQKALRDFPAYDAASDLPMFSGSHLKCRHCEALFSNTQVCLPPVVSTPKLTSIYSKRRLARTPPVKVLCGKCSGYVLYVYRPVCRFLVLSAVCS
jgi:hypothetical protein